MREVLRARCSKQKFLFSNIFCNNHYFKTIIIKTSQKVSPNTELNVDTLRGFFNRSFHSDMVRLTHLGGVLSRFVPQSFWSLSHPHLDILLKFIILSGWRAILDSSFSAEVAEALALALTPIISAFKASCIGMDTRV
jgi:hypothetical protein